MNRPSCEPPRALLELTSILMARFCADYQSVEQTNLPYHFLKSIEPNQLLWFLDLTGRMDVDRNLKRLPVQMSEIAGRLADWPTSFVDGLADSLLAGIPIGSILSPLQSFLVKEEKVTQSSEQLHEAVRRFLLRTGDKVSSRTLRRFGMGREGNMSIGASGVDEGATSLFVIDQLPHSGSDISPSEAAENLRCDYRCIPSLCDQGYLKRSNASPMERITVDSLRAFNHRWRSFKSLGAASPKAVKALTDRVAKFNLPLLTAQTGRRRPAQLFIATAYIGTLLDVSRIASEVQAKGVTT